MQQLKKLPFYLFVLFSFLILQACSGGSGGNESGSGGNEPTNPGDPQNGYSISVDNTTITVRQEALTASNASFDINVTFVGDGLIPGLAPDSVSVPWAQYQFNDVTANSAKLTVNIVNTESLNFTGTSSTTLRLTTGNVGTSDYAYQDITISLELWQLATATTAIEFTETFGAATLPSQTIDIISSDVDWTLTSDVDWLSFDNASGNGDQTVTLTVDPQATSVSAAGVYQGTVTLTETASGEEQEIPVSLALDSIRLASNYSAISLYKLNNQENTTETINISDNALTDINWTATTADAWLDVSIDSSNNTVTVSKNSTLLADGQHFGEVTISSVTNGVAESSTIAVGYYQSASDTTTVTLTDFTITTIESVAFDPLRPLIYLAGDNKITVHHLFSGALVNTITTPMSLTNLAISPSGQYLLASAIITTADENGNNVNQLHVYNLDLTNQALTEISLPSENPITFMPHYIAQINGQEIIITEAQEYATQDLTRHDWQLDEQFFLGTVQHAADTNTITVLRTTGSPTDSTFYNFDINYHAFATQKVSVSTPRTFTTTTYQDAAPRYFDINNSGDTIFTAQDSSETLTVDDVNFTENGVLFDTDLTSSVDVKTDKEGNSYYYRARLNNDENIPAIFSLTKYDSNLNEVWREDIANASGSSFINTNYHRFITVTADTAGTGTANQVWFITSFAD